MRDKLRIKRVLDKLSTIWEYYPDLRFWQMLINITNFKGHDVFFFEDKLFEAELDKEIRKIQNRKK